MTNLLIDWSPFKSIEVLTEISHMPAYKARAGQVNGKKQWAAASSDDSHREGHPFLSTWLESAGFPIAQAYSSLGPGFPRWLSPVADDGNTTGAPRRVAEVGPLRMDDGLWPELWPADPAPPDPRRHHDLRVHAADRHPPSSRRASRNFPDLAKGAD